MNDSKPLIEALPVIVWSPTHVLAVVLSGNWSCIATSTTGVPALKLYPVPPVIGSAVLDTFLVHQVIVTPDTPVKSTHSFWIQSKIYILPFVTVGATPRVITVSVELSDSPRIVENHDSYFIDIMLDN